MSLPINSTEPVKEYNIQMRSPYGNKSDAQMREEFLSGLLHYLMYGKPRDTK